MMRSCPDVSPPRTPQVQPTYSEVSAKRFGIPTILTKDYQCHLLKISAKQLLPHTKLMPKPHQHSLLTFRSCHWAPPTTWVAMPMAFHCSTRAFSTRANFNATPTRTTASCATTTPCTTTNCTTAISSRATTTLPSAISMVLVTTPFLKAVQIMFSVIPNLNSAALNTAVAATSMVAT